MDTNSRRNLPGSYNKTFDQRGFTLIEMMIASLVLAVGVISISSLIGYSVSSNFMSKNDTVATGIAERELERLRSLGFSALADGGSPLNSGGTISFSGSPVSGYSSAISMADSETIGHTVMYDIRWNITTFGNASGDRMKKITIAAQRSGGNVRVRAVHLYSLLAP